MENTTMNSSNNGVRATNAKQIAAALQGMRDASHSTNPAGRSEQTSPSKMRADLQRIGDWIEPGSHVLDLGCGNGTLLNYLQKVRQVSGIGVEIKGRHVVSCIEKGLQVVQQNLEDGLALFDSKQFDVVVLSQTLQAMHNTEHILMEMARVADYGIVSFPNFGHWTHWWSILNGRMPVTGQMPYEWYNTPNIHLCTLGDFEKLAKRLNLQILRRCTFNTHEQEVSFWSGWRSSLALYYFKTPAI